MKNVRQPGSATEKRIMPAFLDQQTVVAVHLVPRIPVHSWAKWQKNRPKLNSLKNRLIDWSVIIPMLRTVWQILNSTAGNGSYVNRLKSLKKSWNHIKWTCFRRILATWNHCVVQRKWTGGKPSTWKKQHHCVGRQPKLLKILLGLSIVSNNLFGIFF